MTVLRYTHGMGGDPIVIRELTRAQWPEGLSEIPDPPKKLWLTGEMPPKEHKLLTVVGSRMYTGYGRDACEHFIAGLAGYPVSIVSGLALGIDGIAHRAALKVGLHTVAIPGSGLGERVLYPATHRRLAREIVTQGGALLSEYEPEFKATRWSFPQRNRLMAGIAHATLIIEASTKSGTLITARMVADYNRELLVVPGSIFSKNSEGPHLFMKLGATPVTCAEDILAAVGIEAARQSRAADLSALPSDHRKLLDLLTEPRSKNTLIEVLDMSPATVSGMLMELELQGYVVERNGLIRRSI